MTSRSTSKGSKRLPTCCSEWMACRNRTASCAIRFTVSKHDRPIRLRPRKRYRGSGGTIVDSSNETILMNPFSPSDNAYLLSVDNQDQALCYLFFHCCMEDEQFTASGLDDLTAKLIVLGLPPRLDIR